MSQNLAMIVNGHPTSVTVEDPQMPLLYVLRNDLGLKGPHFGCGLAQCGACAVHVDGQAVRSCSYPASEAAGKNIVTLEGLGTPERPHPLQEAFIAEQAVQCGYCTNGMIMESAALLARTPRPTEAQVREALANNICRCGTHPRVVAAVLRAAKG
ncbi:MAG: (2Fe-2S)-binding protein [Acetobacteraceae bacterium]|nr:(2Fe-2S)-binding protein [Acetobacteraceae bacterium]